jgi:hypothetical protein
MRRASPYDVFLSYRRTDNNPTRLRDYLNTHLYDGAVYMDLYATEMRDLVQKAKRGGQILALDKAEPGAAGRTGDPRGLLNERQQEILRKRIRGATLVLILLDRHFHADFVAAGNRENDGQIDWVRKEIEYVFEFKKEAIVLYGFPDERLEPERSKAKLGSYEEMKPLVDGLLLCESAIVEFSDEMKVEAQLKDLAGRLRPRLVRYWRHKAHDAERSYRLWRYSSLLIASLFLAATLISLTLAHQRDLSDWLRWRHGHDLGPVEHNAYSINKYIDYEKKSLGDRDDRWSNGWKELLFAGFTAESQGGQPQTGPPRQLVIVESGPFDTNYRTFGVWFSLKRGICLVEAYAFLFDSRKPAHLRDYRQLSMKPHTDCKTLGSSFIQVDSGNQYDRLLLILGCRGEGVDKKDPNDFLSAFKVE